MAEGSRALRRVAADLALLDIEDVSAILADLPGPARARMSVMIAGFRAGTPLESAESAAIEAGPYSGWMEARLGDSDAIGTMTVHARETLRALAAEAGWVGRTRVAPTRASAFSAFMGRVR